MARTVINHADRFDSDLSYSEVLQRAENSLRAEHDIQEIKSVETVRTGTGEWHATIAGVASTDPQEDSDE